MDVTNSPLIQSIIFVTKVTHFLLQQIKVQQQRMTDLKKTLQRELKVQALPNDEMESNNLVGQHSHSLSMDSLNNHTVSTDSRSSPVPMLQTSGSVTRNMHTNKYIEKQLDRASPEPPRRASSRRQYEEDVNFAYLKHVVLKFMLSRESEVSYLILVLATCGFTNFISPEVTNSKLVADVILLEILAEHGTRRKQ